MPDASAFLHAHQGELVAVGVGILLACALLALARKAIAVVAVLLIVAAGVVAWWLAREHDALAQVQELLHGLR